MICKERFIILLISVVCCLTAAAQQLWTTAKFKYSPTKNVGINASAEYRTHNGLKSSERYSLSIGGDYKVKFLKFDAGYVFMQQQSEERITSKGNVVPPYWVYRNRGYVSATGKYKYQHFDFSLRERYQFTHRCSKYVPKFSNDGITQIDDEWVAAKNKHVLRSRIGAEWSKKKCKYSPYVNVEMYNDLSNKFSIDKTNFTAGSEYKINKHNSVEMYYRFVLSGSGIASENIHVIGLGYNFKL